MKRYRIVSYKRFFTTIAVATCIPIIIFQLNSKSTVVDAQVQEPVTQVVQVPQPQVERTPVVQVPQPVILKNEIQEQEQLYISYMKTFGLSTQRAQLILNSIKDTNTDIPTSLILAMIQKESKFKNIKTNTAIEDSAGYVQMKSKTIEWLKSNYPSLPTIKSQDDFIASPDTQIKYMIAYLEYANEKYNHDFTEAVSSYNMGLFADKINHYYVDEVANNKEAIETF